MTATFWVQRWKRLPAPPADAALRAARLGRDLRRWQDLQSDVSRHMALCGLIIYTNYGADRWRDCTRDMRSRRGEMSRQRSFRSGHRVFTLTPSGEYGQAGDDQRDADDGASAGPFAGDDRAQRSGGDRLGERQSGDVAGGEKTQALGEQDVRESGRDRAEPGRDRQAFGAGQPPEFTHDEHGHKQPCPEREHTGHDALDGCAAVE